MSFDSTIHLGDVIMLLGMLGGVLVAWGRFSSLETKVSILMDWFQGNVVSDERRTGSSRR